MLFGRFVDLLVFVVLCLRWYAVLGGCCLLVYWLCCISYGCPVVPVALWRSVSWCVDCV